MMLFLKAYLFIGFIFSLGVMGKAYKEKNNLEIWLRMKVLFMVTFLWGLILISDKIKLKLDK